MKLMLHLLGCCLSARFMARFKKAFLITALGLLIAPGLLMATTYRTIASGHWSHSSNWLNGNAPGNTIQAGDSVIVEHDMFWNLGGDLEVYGSLEVLGAFGQRTNLMLPSGKDVRIYGNARVVLISAYLNNTGAAPSGNASLFNANGYFYAFNSVIEIARYIKNENAISILRNSCVSVGRDYTSTNTEETIEGTAITVGINTKGGFQFSGGFLECEDARFEVLSKKDDGFEISSGTVSGFISAIVVDPKGDIEVSSSVNGNIELDSYCLENGNLINSGAFITHPGAHDCNVAGSFFPCSAFAVEFSFDDAHVVMNENDTMNINILNYLYDNAAILDAGELSPNLIVSPQHGALSWDPLNSVYEYIPDTGFYGEDTFSYVVCDNIPLINICDTASVYLVVTKDESVNNPIVADTGIQNYSFNGSSGQNWQDAVTGGWSGFQVEQVHDPDPMFFPDNDFLGLKYNEYNRLGSTIESPPVDFGDLKSFNISFKSDGFGSVTVYIADSTDELYQIGHHQLPGGYGNGFTQTTEISINEAWLFDEEINTNLKGTPTILIEYENSDKSSFGRIMDLKMEGDRGTVWLGNHTNLWFQADDWTNGYPTRYKEGLIPNERPRYPRIYGDAESSYLKVEDQAYFVIKPNSTLTSYGPIVIENQYGMCIHADPGQITGSFIDKAGIEGNGGSYIEQYVTQEKWHYTSSPIADGLSKTYLSLYLIPFIESQNDWGNYIVPLNVPLNVMQGYGVWSSAFYPAMGDTTVWFGGKPNTGPKSINITNSEFTGHAQEDGWNLVGNPYPSAVHWDSLGWDKSHITGSVYTWDPDAMTYRVYMGEGMGIPYGITGEIQQGQGFFVKAVSNGTFGVDNRARMHSVQAWLKNSTQPKNEDCVLYLAVDGNTYHDETAIRFKDGASQSYENNNDAYKLMSTEDHVPQLYSLIPGQTPVRLAINTYPLLSSNVSIPLGFHYGTAGNYAVSINALQGFPSNLGLMLEDLKLDTIVSLDAQNPYNFLAEAGDAEARFVLHFEPAILKGLLTYNGDTARPLSNVELNITEQTTAVSHTTLTGADGIFTLANIPDGVYEISPELSGTPWKGINATDALLVSRHFVGLQILSPLEQAAGDVDGSGYTNAADALAIQQRFAGMITSFAGGEWAVGNNHIGINGNGEHTPLVSAICKGDVNASWNNSKRQGDILMTEYGHVNVESNDILDLQFFTGTSCQLGALTLSLELPDGMTVENVVIARTDVAPVYKQDGNKLAITWFSLNPVQLEQNDLLLTLRVNANQVPVDAIKLLPESEAANESAEVIHGFKLLVPSIIDESTAPSFSIFPNPAYESIQLDIHAELEGTVNVDLMDASGRIVRTWVKINVAGQNSHKLNLDGLNSGHYVLRLTSANNTPETLPVILMK